MWICFTWLFRFVDSLQEYEMLDSFWYALENEEFEAKWEALGWPFRLANKMEEIYSTLEAETEVFLKLQGDDELMLQDRIELITSTITHMASMSDFSKVSNSSYSTRCKRLTVTEVSGLPEFAER